MSERELDQLLVERAQRGDKRAFELLVEKYQRKLARLLSRLVRDPGEVEDVTQETFIKASEGVVKMMVAYLRQEFSRNLLRKLAALAAMPVLNALRERMDPGRYNGASLVGLRGIVIKSHGSADRFAFGQALKRAADEVSNDVVARIADRMAALQSAAPQQGAA